MKTNLHSEKRTINCGAGHTIVRWAVVQDGGIREYHETREAAEQHIATLSRNWESQDE